MSSISDQSANESSTPIDLGDVQETLLIPLYYRAMESVADRPAFVDQKAIEILPRLNYDFSGFDQAWSLRNDVVTRTVIFDELVADFIKRHPDGRVINLGAGLDARFWRLDNGQIRWYDLDMPDSIALREPFLCTGERNHVIAKSMFDRSWFDDISEVDDDETATLIVAEALFIYFDEALIRDLFDDLTRRFPGAEILFQSICPAIVGRKSVVPILRRTRAELKWGIHTGRELESWDCRPKFLGEWSLVDRLPARWRYYRWVKRLPMIGRHLREVMKISRMRLAGPPA